MQTLPFCSHFKFYFIHSVDVHIVFVYFVVKTYNDKNEGYKNSFETDMLEIVWNIIAAKCIKNIRKKEWNKKQVNAIFKMILWAFPLKIDAKIILTNRQK